MLQINFLSVLVSAAVSFVLGFLFHGPVSGKLWMKLANIHPTGNEKFSDMYGKMFWNFIANLVTAFIIAVIFSFVFTSSIAGPATWLKGAGVSILFWLGFLVPSSSIEVIWMGKNWKLWAFEAVCSFIIMAIIGVIIAVW
jgi:hypothetical protein